MQLLRRGDAGLAVAEVRAMLTSQGLLPPQSHADTDTETEASVFDITLEHAVRTFQQRRGLITDGVVGRATYQALCDARLEFGCRMLSYIVTRPMRGDDVFTLQERLLELG
ncbi:MAG: peptidoglycan-binding protein, partial [Actinomycetota bacterium]|nr:peptidoglycan-binding protein [Actinomycetota bacterium]